MKKKVFVIVALVLAVMMLAACTPAAPAPAANEPAAPAPAAPAPEPAAPAPAAPANEPAAPASADESKPIKIGITFPNFAIFPWLYEKDCMVEAANAAGIETVVVVAENDINKQASQIEDFIATGCSAIICIPCDSDAIVASVEYCQENGVPFIGVGKLPSDLSSVAYAYPCDNYGAADLAAELMVARAKEKGDEKVRCVEIVGDLKDVNGVERHEGFVAAAQKNGIEIVDSIVCNYNSEEAYANLNASIQKLGKDGFNAIYSANDTVLPSVISCLKKNDMFFAYDDPKHITVTGIDGDVTAIQMLRSGEIDGTVNTDFGDFGRLGMAGAIDAAKGILKASPDNVIPVPSKMLTAANLESYGDTIWGIVAEKQQQ